MLILESEFLLCFSLKVIVIVITIIRFPDDLEIKSLYKTRFPALSDRNLIRRECI